MTDLDLNPQQAEEHTPIAHVSVIQQLHDLQINCGVQSFHDAGGQWTAWIGDPMNGRKSTQDGLASFAACEVWLYDQAVKLYPHMSQEELA